MGNQSETIIQSKPNTGLTEFDLYAGERFFEVLRGGQARNVEIGFEVCVRATG